MNILITGGNFVNKGAELMLVSLVSTIKSRFPDAKILISPLLDSPEKIEGLGMKRLNFPLFHYGNSRLFEYSLKVPFLIKPYLKLKGVNFKGDINLNEIDVVFDISGFAFGDKWGSYPLKQLSIFAKKMKMLGSKFILLPQAFGSFEEPGMQQYLIDLVNNVDLVFPRDEKSLQFINLSFGAKSDKVVLAPDITLTFKKEIKIDDKEFANPFVAIVPNERMLDKASEQWQNRYHDVLRKSIVDILSNSDFNVVMLIHAQGVSNDAKVGKEILDKIPQEFATRVLFYVEEDPVRLKAIISKAKFIIGSRFHAVASSLSSNVPAIGTSWLHKYEMLFADYGCADFSFKEPDDKLYEKVNYLLKNENRSLIIDILKKINMDMKQKYDKMWELIDATIKK